MGVTVTVDTRERGSGPFSGYDFFREVSELAKASAKSEVTVLREQMPHGDFKVSGDGVEFLVERKTHADLASSLRSKHRDEQRAALDAYRRGDESGRRFVVWLLEGPLTDGWSDRAHGNGVTNGALDSCMDSFQLVDGCYVHWTASPRHTTAYVAKTLVRRAERGAEGVRTEDARKTMTNAVAGTKRKALACSKHEDGFTYDCMLTVVPGVTPQVAARVRAMYPSLAALFAGFREGAESAIADAKPTPESKKRIGPAIAKRLKTLFS